MPMVNFSSVVVVLAVAEVLEFEDEEDVLLHMVSLNIFFVFFVGRIDLIEWKVRYSFASRVLLFCQFKMRLCLSLSMISFACLAFLYF